MLAANPISVFLNLAALDQVHCAAKQGRQFFCHAIVRPRTVRKVTSKSRRGRIEEIHVAVGPEVVTERRAKDFEPGNFPTPAEIRDLFQREFDGGSQHAVSCFIIARIVFAASHGSEISMKPQRPKPP